MKAFSLIAAIATIVFCLNHADAQTNSRNWVNLQQVMVGGQTSMTSTAFSAFNSVTPFKYYALSVNPDNGSTTWDIRLEGSLDQINWTAIIANSNVTASPQYQPNANPALYLRLRAASLTNAAVVTATAVGVP